MCGFIGAAIVVQHPWSKIGERALRKGTDRIFILSALESNQKRFCYWPNALTARLPNTQMMCIQYTEVCTKS